MKYRLLSILLIFSSLGLFAQSKVYKAEFRSLLNGEPVMYAKISTPDGNSRLTNYMGYVEIPLKPGQDLTVAHLTYDTLRFDPFKTNLNDTNLFYLTPRTFELKELTFSILGPRYTFDNRFAELDLGLSDAEKVRERLEIEDMVKELKNLDYAAADGIRLGSPITAIYERFSKAAEEQRKYRALIANHERDSINFAKYNIRVVQALTEFNDTTAQEFIRFCSFHEDYIKKTDPFLLYLQILECRSEFLAIKD